MLSNQAKVASELGFGIAERLIISSLCLSVQPFVKSEQLLATEELSLVTWDRVNPQIHSNTSRVV